MRIVYVGQKGDRFAQVVSDNESIDESVSIFAGKFRRYHGEGWRQILDVKTILLNIRDVFYVIFGTLQMIWMMRTLKPQTVFIKGGFVGVPVGLAAALWRIPYITHDSDAIPGLANRIIARWARVHAVALPKQVYPYPVDKTVTVGVPIANEYKLVSDTQQNKYKKSLGIQPKELVLLVTGGGLGSRVINETIVAMSREMLTQYPQLRIVHMAGHRHHKDIVHQYTAALPKDILKRVTVKDYVTDMYVYSGAADVVIARAGATNMAELAAQGKACIIIPSPALAGGHQLHNAAVYEKARAARVIQQRELQQDQTVLTHALNILLHEKQDRLLLARQLHTFSYTDSAKKLATLLIEQQKKG